MEQEFLMKEAKHFMKVIGTTIAAALVSFAILKFLGITLPMGMWAVLAAGVAGFMAAQMRREALTAAAK